MSALNVFLKSLRYISDSSEVFIFLSDDGNTNASMKSGEFLRRLSALHLALFQIGFQTVN